MLTKDNTASSILLKPLSEEPPPTQSFTFNEVTSYAYFLQNKDYKIKNVILLYKAKKSHFEALSSKNDGTKFIISPISTKLTKEHPYFSYNEEVLIDNLKKYL